MGVTYSCRELRLGSSKQPGDRRFRCRSTRAQRCLRNKLVGPGVSASPGRSASAHVIADTRAFAGEGVIAFCPNGLGYFRAACS